MAKKPVMVKFVAVEAMMVNIDGKTKSAVFVFAGYLREMEDFLRVKRGL